MGEQEIKAEIKALFKAWKRNYLPECKVRAGVPVTTMNKRRLDAYDQVEFVRLYLGFMCVNGLTTATLKRIERFLSLQQAGNPERRMAVHFTSTEVPNICVLLDDLDDIDLADAHVITGFSVMDVFREKGREWNNEAVREVVKAAREDLGFDYGEVRLDVGWDKRVLRINCEIDSAIDILRFGAVYRNSFLKKTARTIIG